jgi:hypothetical protein
MRYVMRKEPQWHKVVKWGFFFVIVAGFLNFTTRNKEVPSKFKKEIVKRPDDGLITQVKLQIAFYQLELYTVSFVLEENQLSYEGTKQRPHAVLDLKS